MAIRPSFSAPGTDRTLSSGAAPWDWRTLSDQTGQMAYNASKSSIDAARQQALGAAMGGDPFQEQQRAKIRALTEGRAGELANDPRMNQAMDFFGQVLGGSKLPFSEETQRAQLNQQANGTAAANAAQLRALEEAIVARGGSLQDPSFLAQKQEMMSNRQGQNLDALGRMLSQAGIANYNAQAQGANALAGIRSGQNNQINQMNLAGAGYEHGFRSDRDEGDFNGGGSSTFTTSILGGGRGSVAPAFNPTAYLNGGTSSGGGLAGGTGRTAPASAPAPAGAAGAPAPTTPMSPTWMRYQSPISDQFAKPQTFGSKFIRPVDPGQI
jgi:hypothetical protein